MGIGINIAIDGHSSCGKSTIAKNIAKRYSMKYIDTGAMYRAITLFSLENNLIQDKIVNIKALEENLDKIDVIFSYNPKLDISKTLLNGLDVDFKIRSHMISENVSIISQIKSVRNKLINIQKDTGRRKNVVMDGRDIGTKVLPDAEIKFFVTADIKERAKRRFKEQVNSSFNITFEEIYNNLIERDNRDSNRAISPLKKDVNAIVIDTTDLSRKEQEEVIFNIINKEIKEHEA